MNFIERRSAENQVRKLRISTRESRLIMVLIKLISYKVVTSLKFSNIDFNEFLRSVAIFTNTIQRSTSASYARLLLMKKNAFLS